MQGRMGPMKPKRRTGLPSLIARMDQEIADLAGVVRGPADKEQKRHAASFADAVQS